MTRKHSIEIVPSLLACDLAQMGEAIQAVKAAKISWVSVDIMDGHFVPNLSFGPDHVRMAKKYGLTVDSHLMVEDPESIAPWFTNAGADIVTFHIEAAKNAKSLAQKIRKEGKKAGIALRPQTPADRVLPLLPEIDLVLVMTVDPGFGGAHFMKEMLPKISTLRQAIDSANLDCWIQADGGINPQTALLASEAGADSLVAGTAIFGQKNITQAAQILKDQVKNK